MREGANNYLMKILPFYRHFRLDMVVKNAAKRSRQHAGKKYREYAQRGMYILQVGPFSPPTGPNQGRFFSHFLFSFNALRAHSETSYSLKLVHIALKALTKP